MEQSKKLEKTFSLLLNLLNLIVCILPFVYFVAYRLVDYAICHNLAANRVGISLFDSSIREYIIDTIEPGLNRDELLNELKRIGSIEFEKAYTKDYDSVRLNICTHPLNNIWILLRFTPDGKFDSLSFEGLH